MRIVLCISGSDPTGGAGLQLDLQVCRALGVHGAGVMTGLTVQDSKQVARVLPAFPSVVLDQLRTLVSDVVPQAVKLGMLATDDVTRSVALALESLPDRAAIPLVIDPVLAASDGTRLLERRAIPALLDLLEHATLVTPNASEAAELAGCDTSSEQGIEAAARILVDELHAHAALITGGDREGPPRDLLAVASDGSVRFTWLEGERIDVGRVHGTGCALSSSIAAELSKGSTLEQAVETARSFVATAIRNSHVVGSGARFLGFSQG